MNWSVRPADEHDLPAVSAIRIRSWQAGYAGILPGDALAAMDPHIDLARRREFWLASRTEITTLVAVREDGVIGAFVIYGPLRDDDRDLDEAELSRREGEVYALYTDPPHWGTGAGRALLAESVRALHDRDLVPVRLWVLAGNARARRFYEAGGFAADGLAQDFRFGGARAEEVRYSFAAARP